MRLARQLLNLAHKASSGAIGPHLEEAVHIGLHVGDGHPLHDDVRDSALQRLPLDASDSGGVDADRAPV